jgi:hypothetical protein
MFQLFDPENKGYVLRIELKMTLEELYEEGALTRENLKAVRQH